MGRKQSVGSEQTVQNNFNELYIDDNKTDVNDNVKNPCDWSGDHFGLPQSNSYHIGPALRGSICSVNLMTNPNVPFDKKYVSSKQKDGCK